MGQSTSRTATRRPSRRELETSLSYEKEAKTQALARVAGMEARVAGMEAQASGCMTGWQREQELREREAAEWQNRRPS